MRHHSPSVSSMWSPLSAASCFLHEPLQVPINSDAFLFRARVPSLASRLGVGPASEAKLLAACRVLAACGSLASRLQAGRQPARRPPGTPPLKRSPHICIEFLPASTLVPK